MKKFFSLIALVGVFAACQPETIETTFEPDPAVATITVSVYDLASGSDVTGSATITPSEGSLVGNVITLTGNPAISAKTITVSASYNGASNSETVKINALLAGGKADYTVTVQVGEVPVIPDPDPVIVKTYSWELTGSEELEEKNYTLSTASHSHAYSHNGVSIDNWMLNATEFILELTTNYQKRTGNKAEGDCTSTAADDNTQFDAFVEAFKVPAYCEDVLEYSFTVSSWAYYNVLQTVNCVKNTYTVSVATTKDGVDQGTVEIGTIEVETYSSSIEAIEFAYNNHYEYGHGHGTSTHDEHGNSENAGGGIAYGD